jgi:D-alanyl-D-alanine carboxypeptidase
LCRKVRIRSFYRILLFTLLVMAFSGVGCASADGAMRETAATVLSSTTSIPTFPPSITPSPYASETPVFTPTVNSIIATEKSDPPPATPTPKPTSSPKPTSTNTATATIIPSPTKAGRCRERIPSDDLLTLVTSEYAISADYVPGDLVTLSPYLSAQATLGYDTQLRRIAVPSLVHMMAQMQREGLSPRIISGYRSYSAQAFAWQKWLEREPGRAAIISVPPGHSEHQLGTTLDFGSPELAAIVGDDSVEFHTYFYKTSEGEWLDNHAHEYGFTLSYPLEAFEITGFYYEPWHYRYIGIDLATKLKNQGISLTQYLLENYEAPCDP